MKKNIFSENGNEKIKPKLILPVGISGSGKSTWIKSQINDNTFVVSPDEIRKEISGDISDQSKNSIVWMIAFEKVAEYLNDGKNVILDATNIESKNRRILLDFLKKNVKNDFVAYAKIFNVDPDVAKERIKRDIENNVVRSKVPDNIIDKQYEIFKRDLDSLENEGFIIIKESKITKIVQEEINKLLFNLF